MDPLSVTASVIAVVQATLAVGKGIRHLRALRDIPAAFLDLTNELTTLHAILKQIGASLQELDKDVIPDIHPLPSVHSAAFETCQSDLKQLVEDLDDLCERLKKPGRKDLGEKSTELHQVSKVRWHREKDNVARLKERARKTSHYLMLCFNAIQSSQTARQTALMVEIRQLVQTSLDKADEGREFTHQKALDLELAIRTGLSPQSHHTTGGNISDDSSQLVSFNASIRLTCAPACRCQCHSRNYTQSPKWITAVLGTLFLQYNTIPVLAPRRCDIPACRSTRSSIKFSYFFPKWLLSRAVYISTSWDSLKGQGSSLHLHVPRVLWKSHVFLAIMRGDIAWIQRAISAREILPTDISPSGSTLVASALRWRSFDIAAFLVQRGFNTTWSGLSPRSAAGESQIIILSGERALHPVVKYLGGRCEGDEIIASSPIRDSVLGIGALSLPEALSLDRGALDKVDYLSFSPLHWAILRSDVQAVKTLVDSRANLGLRAFGWWTPLSLAAAGNDLQIAQILLDAGIDVNEPSGRGSTPLLWALDRPGMMRLLLDKGAKVTVKSDDGLENPLTSECSRAYAQNVSCDSPLRRLWRRSLELLISIGIDLDLPVPGWDGASSLLLAVRLRNNAMVDLLIELGARVDVVDQSGRGILHFAAMHGDLEQIEVLRRAQIRGISPDALDESGCTPLSLIAGRMTDKEEILHIAPDCRRPTFSEFLLFKELVEEIRLRNKGGNRLHPELASASEAVVKNRCVRVIDDSDEQGSGGDDSYMDFDTDRLRGSIIDEGDGSWSERQSLIDFAAQEEGEKAREACDDTDREDCNSVEFFDAKSRCSSEEFSTEPKE